MAQQIYCYSPCMWHPPRLWFNPCSCTFYYIIIVTKANIGIHWNLLEFPWNMGIPMDSNTFQWIPMETIPRGSWIPTDSTGFCQILLEIPWNGKPKWLRLQPNGFCWNSNIPAGIQWILLELMEESKDLVFITMGWHHVSWHVKYFLYVVTQ